MGQAEASQALTIVTLVIAFIGAATGIASLTWSIVSHAKSGVRIKVDFTPGFVAHGGLVRVDPAKARRIPEELAGAPAVVAITVRNVGRLPAIVNAVGIGTDALWYIPPQSDLWTTPPVDVPVSGSRDWILTFDHVLPMVAANKLAKRPSRGIFARASLGSGQSVKSRPISVDAMSELFHAYLDATTQTLSTTTSARSSRPRQGVSAFLCKRSGPMGPTIVRSASGGSAER